MAKVVVQEWRRLQSIAVVDFLDADRVNENLQKDEDSVKTPEAKRLHTEVQSPAKIQSD